MSFFCTDEGNNRKIISLLISANPLQKNVPSLKRKKIRNFDILIFFPDFYRNEEEFWNDTNLEGFYQGQVIYNIVRGGRASNLELSGLAQ